MTTWLSSYNKKQQPDESVLAWLPDSHPTTRSNNRMNQYWHDYLILFPVILEQDTTNML